MDDVFTAAPNALDELACELFRRADDAMRSGEKSQLTACLQLGLRSASVMNGMSRLLDLHTLDSYESLNRAALEARDPLMNFRFNDNGTRKKIGYWFAGVKDTAWKADHSKIEKFLKSVLDTPLAQNWSKVTVLTHPTKYAADNSTVVIGHRMTGLPNGSNVQHKRADYVVGIARLIFATVRDLPGWVPLGLNHAAMPSFQSFCQGAELIAAPILNAPIDHPLPDYSIRPPKSKI